MSRAKRKPRHAPKQSLGGKPITRKQALKGLGDPATWPAELAKIEAEFKRKPGKVGHETYPTDDGTEHGVLK